MGRSYGQYCGLARSLDVVGDRWNLLIVRQLLMGPARYGELREGLSGIATNLLTDRLRDLETAGVIERQLSGAYGGQVGARDSDTNDDREDTASLHRAECPVDAR